MNEDDWWGKQKKEFIKFAKRPHSQPLAQHQKDQFVHIIPSNSSILIIGCSKGQFIELALQKGNRVTAIDFPEIISQLKKNKRFPECRLIGVNVDKDPLPKGDFDLVIAVHILEHLIYDFKFLKKAWSVLKEGGHLLVAVPLTPVREEDRWHIRGYSLLSLKKLFQIAGFEVEYLKGIHYGNVIHGKKVVYND